MESEDLVFTLETIVEKFGEEMAPYAVGVCQHLTQAFWRACVRPVLCWLAVQAYTHAVMQLCMTQEYDPQCQLAACSSCWRQHPRACHCQAVHVSMSDEAVLLQGMIFSAIGPFNTKVDQINRSGAAPRRSRKAGEAMRTATMARAPWPHMDA